MIAFIGVLASVLFAISAIPETVGAIRRGYTQTPLSMSAIVLTAVVLMWFYMTAQHGIDLIFSINSASNTFCWTTLLIYGVKRQCKSHSS